MATESKQPVAASNAADKDRLDAALSRASAVRRESQREGAQRERPAIPGGMRLKLAVAGEIPGYHLYWENDDDGAIEQLLYEGFEFAEPSEVRMQSAIVQDADLGNRVSRYVGKKADGTPMRAYLLKCPDDIWAEREAQRHVQADAWESDIQTKVREDGRYQPKGTSASVDTKFRKQY